ncbi:MAG TPA: lysophospholipase [Stellaceae bacterium]|nr:lysophospholipase [Stellaceae bacterium]
MMRSPANAGRRRAPRQPRRWRIAVMVPLALLAPLVLLLSTCGPPGDVGVQLAAFAPRRPLPAPQVPAHFTDDAFIAADGARLPLRKWLPRGPVRAVILALHGFGDYSHGFAIPAKRWANYGIATYAYDQRGFGAAPDRGLWAGEGQLVVDAIVADRILRRMYPDTPLYIAGESMGGAVAILAMSGAEKGVIPGPGGVVPRADADGVILGAPAVWGRATMDFWPRAALFIAARLVPDMVLTGRGLHVLASDNIPMLRALAKDPLVEKGARVDTIYGLVDLMDDALSAAPRLAAPMLLMYGANDQIVPKIAIRDFTAHLTQAARARDTLAYYPHGYHLLFRDLDGAIVARDVASWIFDRGSALPSYADRAEDARVWPPPGAAPALAHRAMPLASAAGGR